VGDNDNVYFDIVLHLPVLVTFTLDYYLSTSLPFGTPLLGFILNNKRGQTFLSFKNTLAY